MEKNSEKFDLGPANHFVSMIVQMKSDILEMKNKISKLEEENSQLVKELERLGEFSKDTDTERRSFENWIQSDEYKDQLSNEIHGNIWDLICKTGAIQHYSQDEILNRIPVSFSICEIQKFGEYKHLYTYKNLADAFARFDEEFMSKGTKYIIVVNYINDYSLPLSGIRDNFLSRFSYESDNQDLIKDTLRLIDQIGISTLPEHLKDEIKKTLLHIYMDQEKSWNKNEEDK